MFLVDDPSEDGKTNLEGPHQAFWGIMLDVEEGKKNLCTKYICST